MCGTSVEEEVGSSEVGEIVVPGKLKIHRCQDRRSSGINLCGVVELQCASWNDGKNFGVASRNTGDVKEIGYSAYCCGSRCSVGTAGIVLRSTSNSNVLEGEACAWGREWRRCFRELVQISLPALYQSWN